jgi:hypothetical protein
MVGDHVSSADPGSKYIARLDTERLDTERLDTERTERHPMRRPQPLGYAVSLVPAARIDSRARRGQFALILGRHGP